MDNLTSGSDSWPLPPTSQEEAVAKQKKRRQTGGRKAVFERVRRGTLAFAHIQSDEETSESTMKIIGSGFPVGDARGLVLTARQST